MNKATMLGSPTYDYSTESALQCGRDCLADPLCQCFALYRYGEPAEGGINCRRYNERTYVVYDDASVTYFKFNSALPFP